MKRRGRQKNDTKRSTKQDHKPFGNVCRPSSIPIGAGGAGSRAAIPDIQHHIPLYRGTNHRVLRCGTGGKRGIPCLLYTSIPDNDTLISQLSSRKYTVNKDGRLELERKETMKKRGLSSPDIADALALAMYEMCIRDRI